MKDNHYDVGIVGFWYGMNYGSVLTYYALYKVVEECGYKALLINKPLNLWTDKFYDQNTLGNLFFHRYGCKRSRIRTSANDWRDLNNFCDTFLVGSDVVWKYTLPKQCGYHFFLDFVSYGKRKISYASSFGGDWDANEKITKSTKFFLKKFDAVSCREVEGVSICKNIFEIEAKQVIDPVFLLNSSSYEMLIKKSKIKKSTRFITAYILGPGKLKKKMLLELKNLMGDIDLVNIVNAGNVQKGKELLELETEDNLSIEDWLYYIKNCELYIGDSFHGICFAIIFRKNFILIRNRISPSRCRFDSLLCLCGLESRSIYADEDISLRSDLLEDIDYSMVYSKLESEIKKSKDWLSMALKIKKENVYDEYDILDDKINNIYEQNRNLEIRIDELKNLLIKMGEEISNI